MGCFKRRMTVVCPCNVSSNPRHHRECGNTFRTSKPIHKKLYCSECHGKFYNDTYIKLVQMRLKYQLRRMYISKEHIMEEIVNLIPKKGKW